MKMLEKIKQWQSLDADIDVAIIDLIERIETLIDKYEEETHQDICLDRDLDNSWPGTDTDWNIVSKETSRGCLMKVDFEHPTPYEDWTEEATLWIDLEWWSMSDEDLLTDVLNRVKHCVKERELADIRHMKTLAHMYGYEFK